MFETNLVHKSPATRNFTSVLLISLVALLLAGCAGTMRQDLSVIDRAKLDAQAAKIWYLAVYTSLQQTLNDPTIPASVKHTIKRKVNPMMNKLKHTLVAYIDAVQAAENAAKTQNAPVPDKTKIILLQMELNKMITNILNDLTYLGVGTTRINRMLHRNPANLEALKKNMAQQAEALDKEVKQRELSLKNKQLQ